MNESTTANGQPPKWIRLVARIWSAPIILYALFFAVGTAWSLLTNGEPDPYAVEGTTFVESLPPTFLTISTLGLILAWRWEKIGAIFSLVFNAALIITLLIQRLPSDDLSRALIPLLLGLIVLIPAILFLIYGLQKQRSSTAAS